MEALEKRSLFRQLRTTGVLLLVIACVLIYRYTTRTELEEERARARIVLETIHRVQEAYHAEHGTYLRPGRGSTKEMLKWSSVPGRFRYRVAATRDRFAARAEADLDGDGTREVWRVDGETPEPVLVQED